MEDEEEVLRASEAMLAGLPAVAGELDALANVAGDYWSLSVKKLLHARGV